MVASRAALLTLPIAALALGAGGSRADLLLNNGLAPPAPSNVFDAANPLAEQLYLRNQGCPPHGWTYAWDPCPVPGAATEAALIETSGPFSSFTVYDSSRLTMSGGGLTFARAEDDATASLTGGDIVYDLEARHDAQLVVDGVTIGGDIATYERANVVMSGGSVLGIRPRESSSIHLSGGMVLGNLYAYHSATLTVYGDDFEVDGSPVPFGPLTAVTGTLSGNLASGEPLNSTFYQGGHSPVLLGDIVLAPAASPPVVPVLGRNSLIGCMLVGGLWALRRRARRTSPTASRNGLRTSRAS